jgi:hypothetical protein
MRWVGYVAGRGKGEVHRGSLFVTKPEERDHLEERRWVDNIKMDLPKVG